ncbi:EF hand [Gimesia panareensis]|uniref:EF hand n=1 Tax=Gimesia panareensis TaxID=2527978 RepID=A0A518FW02_9PLAN|nr:EF-hand domain-containing protein [Gimesia panareensis]QDV20511.1 EF hand [Gimesia panareensis]
MALNFSRWFTAPDAYRLHAVLLMLACGFASPLAAEEAGDQKHSTPKGISKAAELKARQQFDKADTNGDKLLDEAEYLARLKPEHQKVGRLEFLLSDYDQDQQMSFMEYFSTPAVPLEQRRFPDPVRDRVQELLRTLKSKFAKWDTSADDQLSQEEFQKSQLADSVPGLENTFFPNWDQDEDGQITHEEIERLLEIAYAVRTPEGELLREPNGRVVNWMLFRHLDTNHDNQLSMKELKPQLKDDKKIEDLLKQADQNKDQQLSLKEWKTTNSCWIDPVYYFRRIDKNFDARLNPAELASDSGFHRDLAPYLIPAFDRNADGVLTLYEYLNTPISNPVVKWHVGRKDTNNNGTLSESEFDWNLGLSGRSLIRDYFHFLDQDQNRQLDQGEFLFTTRAQTPRKRFDKADTNEDGVLEQAEYLATLKPEHQKVGRLEFLLSDHDQDQKMSFKEYFSTPAVPLGQRRIPDPVRDRVQQQLEALKESYRQWDNDSNQQLGLLELQQRQRAVRDLRSARSNGIPGLERTSFLDWDRDGDGQISREDAQLLLEIAYAVRTPEGVLLREPTGRVVNWMLFRHLDTDHNGQLSAAELLPRLETENKVERLLKQADRNQDEQLDLAEWKTTDECWIDPVYYFKRIDKNFDARLDPAELASDEGFHRELAPYLIPAFDQNADGVLSLYEYLNTPITNPIVKWHVERKDRNYDGNLSAYEFTWGTGLTGSCLIRDFFNILDVDHNGRLDQREFIVRLDLARAPRELAFKSLDQDDDARLSVDEVFAATKAIVRFKNDIHYQKVRTKFEQEFKELDLDHDERLNLDEFQHKTAVVLLPPYSYSPRMINHFKRNVPTPENKFIPGVVGAFNILLVCAVVFYFVRLKFKK